ncbi:sugar transferase [Roseivivax sp. CAU 1761]
MSPECFRRSGVHTDLLICTFCILYVGHFMRTHSRPRIGFRPRNPRLYRALNFSIGAFLIFTSFPALVAITLLLLATQGREVFYLGERLGKDQRTFRIIKFRTLCSKGARELTRDRTLPHDADIATPLGRFLRDTRLDELPQLFNIVLGDMNICGPRPVRPEIAAIERARIRNYDLRFTVKPGLIGPAQACFGHGTSKRVRARMNNMLVSRPVSIPAELALLGRVGQSVLAKTAGNVLRALAGARLAPAPALSRAMWVATPGDDRLWAVQAIGMRRIEVPGLAFGAGVEPAILYIRLRSNALRKARIALSQSHTFGVLNYSAETEFGESVIERYALGSVVVAPAVEATPVAGTELRGFKEAWA